MQRQAMSIQMTCSNKIKGECKNEKNTQIYSKHEGYRFRTTRRFIKC